MDLGLVGRRALVTGSTKGIGRAIAEALVDEGASVAICARTAADVEASAHQLAQRRAGAKVIGEAFDVANTGALQTWVASAGEQLGGIDIYVHNTSGMGAPGPDGWKYGFDVDLMALVNGVEAAAPLLTADGGGSLVTIGTTASAEHFGPGSGSYSAMKAAVTNWTLGQAQLLGARGIRCNVVSPGPTLFEGGSWQRINKAMPAFYEATVKGHPAGRLGTAQDVADAVAFLVSDRARHINGVNLTVDGGFLKRVDY